MKKLIALLLAALMAVTSIAYSEGWYWEEYNEEATRYVVCGYDDEERCCFTAIVDASELATMAGAGWVFAAYLIDVDGLAEISWNWSQDGYIFYIYDWNGDMIQFDDALPQIH